MVTVFRETFTGRLRWVGFTLQQEVLIEGFEDSVKVENVEWHDVPEYKEHEEGGDGEV